MEEEKVLEKIRRLFELAKSSNEHESALATAKAQELLHKYNLEVSQVPTSTKAPYVKDTVRLKNQDVWAKSLYHVIAKNNGGYVVQLTGTPDIAVIGQRHSLTIIEFLYSQLEYRIRRLSEAAWDLYGEGREMQYKRNFAYGALERLSVRLKKQTETLKQESPESMALVVVANRELDNAVASWFPRLGVAKRVNVGADGYSLGQVAGGSMAIHNGIAGSAGVRRLK